MTNEQRIETRRAVCQEHQETMKEIFGQMDKRLPIWVFLSAISIIGAIFGGITIIQNRTADGLHSRITSHINDSNSKLREISNDVKRIQTSINSLTTKQAVTNEQIRSIAEDVEEVKANGKK